MAGGLGGLLLLFAFVMAGLMAAFSLLAQAALRRVVGRKHQALEQIHLTRRIPAFWTAKYDRKLRALASAGSEGGAAETDGGPIAAKWIRRRRQKVVSELDRLIAYTRRTKLVAGEAARLVLLAKLEALRGEWRDRDNGG